MKSVALIGARGHTGAELIRLLAGHPSLELTAASSRELAGRAVADVVDGVATGLTFSNLSPVELAAGEFDVVILALPNGASAPFVSALERSSRERVIVDLSADHRFDVGWRYGLPEHFRDSLRKAKRIANPGCYATGIQLAVRPLLELIDGPVTAFGVSGYSGAGTAPSPRNDVEQLRDNLMPYALSGHVHEHEAARHLHHPVHFMPHVAAFFRGITLTITMPLGREHSFDELARRYHDAYDDEPLVEFDRATPLVRDIAGSHRCRIGGLTVEERTGRRAIVVVTIDNLLKGAATQALQNINLACGFDEFAGVPLERPADGARQ